MVVVVGRVVVVDRAVVVEPAVVVGLAVVVDPAVVDGAVPAPPVEAVVFPGEPGLVTVEEENTAVEGVDEVEDEDETTEGELPDPGSAGGLPPA